MCVEVDDLQYAINVSWNVKKTKKKSVAALMTKVLV